MDYERIISVLAGAPNTELAVELIFGYPLVTLMLLKMARVCRISRPELSSFLRQASFFLLPAGAVYLILVNLAELPFDSFEVRTSLTVLGLAGISLVLNIAQAALIAVVGGTNAPKLLFDVLRIGLSIALGGVFVSEIWGIDVTKIFAAMGVGSIILGFALQEFLGNLLAGMSLLSARKFVVGDWLIVGGRKAQVVAMDWRTVTLDDRNGLTVVVANSTLAKSDLVIEARANQICAASVWITLGLDIAPEAVRAAVMEAGNLVPFIAKNGGPKMFVTAMNTNPDQTPFDGAGGITYRIILPVPTPNSTLGPRSDFLAQFWYICQRKALRLSITPTPEALLPMDMATRKQLLEATGIFGGDAEAQTRVAASSVFRRYRQGERVTEVGQVTSEALVVVTGSIAMSTVNGDIENPIERVGENQLLVLNEMLNISPSRVQLSTDATTDVLAIPADVLIEEMARSARISRDINALMESRRQAIQPSRRRLRSAA